MLVQRVARFIRQFCSRRGGVDAVLTKKLEDSYTIYQKLLNYIGNSLAGGLVGAAMKLHEGVAPLNVAIQENYLAWREAQT
ncbi:MAG: hypothetical protein ACSLEN_11880 [Candidatus Malihini olakiniferum]